MTVESANTTFSRVVKRLRRVGHLPELWLPLEESELGQMSNGKKEVEVCSFELKEMHDLTPFAVKGVDHLHSLLPVVCHHFRHGSVYEYFIPQGSS